MHRGDPLGIGEGGIDALMDAVDEGNSGSQKSKWGKAKERGGPWDGLLRFLRAQQPAPRAWVGWQALALVLAHFFVLFTARLHVLKGRVRRRDAVELDTGSG